MVVRDDKVLLMEVGISLFKLLADGRIKRRIGFTQRVAWCANTRKASHA